MDLTDGQLWIAKQAHEISAAVVLNLIE